MINYIYFYDNMPNKWIILGLIHKNNLELNKVIAKYKNKKEDPIYECIWRKIRVYKPGYDSWFGLIKNEDDRKLAKYELGLGSVKLFMREVILYITFYKSGIIKTRLECNEDLDI